MDGLNILLILLIVIAFVLIIKHFLKAQQNTKPSHVKKEEIIQSYEEQMKNLQNKYLNDADELKKQKMIFLKTVSMELHRNIFFDEEESKAIIKHLASL